MSPAIRPSARIPLVSLSALFACAAASAGVVIDTVERDLPDGQETGVTTLQIENGRMRVDTVEAGKKAPESSMIYTGDAIIAVDHDEKTYVPMNRTQMKQLAGQVSAAMKQMEAQLASMPPEQRAMVEKMMGKRMPSADKPRRIAPEFTRTARTENAAGYTCQIWEGRRDGQKVSEHCVVPYGKLTGGEEVANVMQGMTGMMEELFEAMDSAWLEGLARNEWEGFRKIDGYPVISRTFSDGKPTDEYALRSARNASISAASFEPPAGYKRKDLQISR